MSSDEPTFVLRAQDKLAPQCVRLYALMCTMQHVNPDKVASVRKAADEMEAWQRTHTCKLPD